MPKSKKASFYAVAVKVGHKPGVYGTWDEASAQITGCHGALHRKFPTRQEAEAWVDGHQNVQVSSSSSSSQSSRPAPYQKPAHKTNSARTNGYASNSNTKDQQGAAAKGWMVAYADGSCLNNGKSSARAGSGVYWDEPRGCTVSVRLPGKQTNQCGELYAFVKAFESDPDPSKPLLLKSDSQYAIKCMTIWLHSWIKRSWKNSQGQPVENAGLIRLAYAMSERRPGPVKFEYVKAHIGIEGNEMADALAVGGANQPEVDDVEWAAALADLEETSKGNNGHVANRDKHDKTACDDEADIDSDWLLDDDEMADLAEKQDF